LDEVPPVGDEAEEDDTLDELEEGDKLNCLTIAVNWETSPWLVEDDDELLDDEELELEVLMLTLIDDEEELELLEELLE
jgi:hypothetical protein